MAAVSARCVCRHDPGWNNSDHMQFGLGHTPPRLTLLDIHGVLMVIAWLGLIPMAVFSARYLRELWPSTTPMGMRIWFHVHRTLNCVAVLLIAVSAAMAFAARGMWTGPWFGRETADNTSPGAWHSLFGLFAIVLAVRQPFNALFRCAPDHPRRPLFNWMHRITGVVAYLCAMVPLFIGVFVRRILHREVSEWILILFQGFLLLLIAGAELLGWLERRPKGGDEQHILHAEECSLDCDGCDAEEGDERIAKLHFARLLLFLLLFTVSVICSTLLSTFILLHN